MKTHGALALLTMVSVGAAPVPFEPTALATPPTPIAGVGEYMGTSGPGVSLRREDSVVAWHDDMIVIVLPGSDLHGADAVAQRLRADARNLNYVIGVVQWRPGERPATLVARAARVASFDRLQRQAERSLTRATRRI